MVNGCIMSKTLDQLNTGVEDFEQSPEGFGIKLRLDFAEIIWNGLQRQQWSQRQLARRAGLADSVVSNLIHGNKNCTLDTVGRVIHAFGTSAVLKETESHLEAAPDSSWIYHADVSNATLLSFGDIKSGQTKIEIKYEIARTGS